MKDTTLQYVADKLTPTPGVPEWYFVLALLAIVTIVLGSMWIDRKFPKKKDSSPEDLIAQARRQAGQNVGKPMTQNEISQLQQILEIQFKSFEQVLDTKLEAVKESTALQIKMLEQKVDNTQKQENHRLASLEKTVSDGFLSVHRRIDRHLEAHGDGEEG